MLKRSSALLAATAIILVAGCNRGGNNATANKAAPANNTASAPANTAAATPAAPATGAPVDAAFLTANAWGPPGCAESAVFSADGTLRDKDGPGTWKLEGNRLTVTQAGQATPPANVSRNGPNLVLSNPANPSQAMTMVACPAAAAGAGAGAGAPDADADAEKAAEGEGE